MWFLKRMITGNQGDMKQNNSIQLKLYSKGSSLPWKWRTGLLTGQRIKFYKPPFSFFCSNMEDLRKAAGKLKQGEGNELDNKDQTSLLNLRKEDFLGELFLVFFFWLGTPAVLHFSACLLVSHCSNFNWSSWKARFVFILIWRTVKQNLNKRNYLQKIGSSIRHAKILTSSQPENLRAPRTGS